MHCRVVRQSHCISHRYKNTDLNLLVGFVSNSSSALCLLVDAESPDLLLGLNFLQQSFGIFKGTLQPAKKMSCDRNVIEWRQKNLLTKHRPNEVSALSTITNCFSLLCLCMY